MFQTRSSIEPITYIPYPIRGSEIDEPQDEDFTAGDQFGRPLLPEETQQEEEEIQVPESPLIIFTCGNNQGPPLTATTIEHVLSMPAYPQTQESGYAYVIPVEQESPREFPSKSEVLDQALSFQYSKASSYKDRPTISPFFNTRAASRYKYTCTGIKACQYLDNTLRTCSHHIVNEELYDKVRNLRKAIQPTLSGGRQKAVSVYQGAMKRFQKDGCKNQNNSCYPSMRRGRETLVGPRPWFIGCSGWKAHEGHFSCHIPPDTDIGYLEELFDRGLPAAEETCMVVEPQASRIKSCGIDHPQGKGRMDKLTCDVTYQILIPNDITVTPYFVLISFGTHSHIPPPPSVIRRTDIAAIERVLRPILTPGLTSAQFLASRELEIYLQTRGFTSVEDLNIAFANKDRITCIIKRERLLRFPFQGGLEGVVYEWRTRHQDLETAYIQKIIPSVDGNVIICFLVDQAKILLEQKTFQMDMSFKRLQGAWAEILVVIFHPVQMKLITLGRIITDTETRDMYQLAFSSFFRLCSERTQKPVMWRHIHGTGFYGTTVDMCYKQMSGFGRYLSSIDPSKRDWRWQLQSCIRFCQVHFTRSITKACPGDIYIEDSPGGRAKAILQATSKEEYQILVDLLAAEEESPALRNWAVHKKNPVIAAGLVQCCSLIPKDIWNTLESHSNAAEQAGQKSYRTGKHVPLLEGIRKAEQMDQQDMKEYYARNEYGIRHSYRGTSTVSERYFRNKGRENKRKRNALQEEFDSDEDEILQISDSSGFIPQRGRRSASRAPGTPKGRSRTQSPAILARGVSPIQLTPTPRSASKLQKEVLLATQSNQAKRDEVELAERLLRIQKEAFELRKQEREFDAGR